MNQVQTAEDAKKEARVAKEELLAEIKTALNDYFVAQIKEEEDGILLRFLNGQQFILQVTER
ncbi:MAG: hypothetical protein IJ308_02990 [Clostridia bacterium]|nr:hypothetical protein [Clostridia bacterium]